VCTRILRQPRYPGHHPPLLARAPPGSRGRSRFHIPGQFRPPERRGGARAHHFCRPKCRFQVARALARVTVIASDGRVLADSAVSDSNLTAVENQLARPEIQQAAATGHGTDLRTNHTTGERTLYSAVSLSSPNQAMPPVFLRLGLPMAALDRQTDRLHRNLAVAFGVTFLIAITLSVWLAHGITKPLSEIATAARQLAKGDHDVRIRTGSQDEVGLLADELSHMTDQLKAKLDELSEDRAQLLAMLTSMVEGVMVLDSRGRVLQINPALERMFDVTRMEVRGHPCSDVFRHPKLDAAYVRYCDAGASVRTAPKN